MPKRIRESIDIQCDKHGLTSHYTDLKGRVKCRACRNEAVDKRRKILKLKSIEYKGGACSKCNYSKCIEALEFHHTDPTQKDFSISHDGHTRSWDIIKIELDKCILVCSNCHREIHFKERNKPQYSLPNEKVNSVGLLNSERKIDKVCETCKNVFNVILSESEDRKFCSIKCSQVGRRKVSDRPAKEDLEKLLWEMPTSNISKIYGVSDKTIEKWSKAYSITKPPRGYWAKKAFGKV